MSCKNTTKILSRLRLLMRNTSHVPYVLNAYIIPSQDAHQSEYVSECDNRRAFVSGFTGSYGTAVVTETEAALWTDPRYYLQASVELDENWILMKQDLPTTPSTSEWLCKNLDSGSIIGADPFLLDTARWKEFSRDLESAGHSLVPVTNNLIDLVWDDRPNRSEDPVNSLDLEFSGMSLSKKVGILRETLKKGSAYGMVLTALDDVAYMFNLRGSDIAYSPVFFSYSLITLDEAYLFVDDSKLTEDAKNSLLLGDVVVKILPYGDLSQIIASVLAKNEEKLMVSHNCSWAISEMIPKERRISKVSPVSVMKAVKNDTERLGLRESHLRDGAALCRYLAWLEHEAPSGTQTEISGATKLEGFRKSQAHFVGLSFPSISSVGPNAAIIHYHPSPSTDRKITGEEIYLIDSGAQYKDGTTDVTRTVHFGTPSSIEKECFTRVLKGHIALAMAVFPEKIQGNRLDSFARKSLWDVGLDYGHGTGHGIGMYLNVHEGPMGISFRRNEVDPGLEEGMFLSNEPGYYEDGKFGIRIENIVEIMAANELTCSLNIKKFLKFKTITLAPIQAKLISPQMLNADELEWLNTYHSVVRESVGPLLLDQGDKSAYDWLIRETQPIG